MCLFVHAIGTTGKDAAARRAHRYATRCAQCGTRVDEPSDRVAAHVIAYPCGIGCCGWMTLRTTCKKCNAKSSTHSPKRSAFWGCSPRMKRLRFLCCVPSCTVYDDS